MEEEGFASLLNVFEENEVSIELHAQVSDSVSRMKKISKNIDREMGAEFLLLSLRVKNSKINFIRVEFQFTEILPSLYILKAGVQLSECSRSFLLR